ncbi:MAG: hypothetical protein L6R36_000934 [Xanthoria steineri]|nr:MAG: hypothetical protein L6R36_000934 [Xanthoria steineri]
MRPLLPPPPPSSPDYSLPLSNLASRILYPNPLPFSSTQHALYILNSAAFPDARETSYDDLVPYVLARLPAEDDLLAGHQYEILFFAKASADDAGKPSKKRRPGWQWCVQTYQLLSRILRKRLSRLWIVGAESWVRMLVEGVMVISGGKGRKKVVFLRSVRDLEGWGVRVSELCVPCGVWVTEKRRRKKRRGSAGEEEGANGRGQRAFGVREPLPRCTGEEVEEGRVRLPRVLREATSFLLMDECVKTEGIFRVNAKAVMVEVLQELYDQAQQFIVWRERDTVLCFPFWRDGTGDVGMDELKEKDGYDVHAAAGLIKLWYKELREPIFPQSCYQALGKFYGDADLQLEPHQLVGMLRPDAEWTILTTTARRILRMHLLPLLSRVVEMEEWNHMAAYGLAVCFTPALLRGPDIEEDMKMMGIARRLLDAMVRHWKEHLAPVFETDHQNFETELRLPEVVADREDPLEEGGDSIPPSEAQMSGITLIDNDGSASDTAQEDGSEEEDEAPPLPQRPAPLPPLPPRPRTFLDSEAGRPSLPPRARSSTIAAIPCTSDPTSSPTTNGVDSPVKRKPAPTVQPLPRYSMVVGTSSSLFHHHQQQPQQPHATLEHIPFYNSVEQPVEEPLDLDPDPELPVYEAMPESSSSASPSANRAAIPRKPVPVKSEKSG